MRFSKRGTDWKPKAKDAAPEGGENSSRRTASARTRRQSAGGKISSGGRAKAPFSRRSAYCSLKTSRVSAQSFSTSSGRSTMTAQSEQYSVKGTKRPDSARARAGKLGSNSPLARAANLRSRSRRDSLPRRRAAAFQASRNSGVAGNSRRPGTVSRSTRFTERWVVMSNSRSEAISEPLNSIRNGLSAQGEKTSTMPPRQAYSPGEAIRSSLA